VPLKGLQCNHNSLKTNYYLLRKVKEKYLFTLIPELELRDSKLLLEIATVEGIYKLHVFLPPVVINSYTVNS
jgi:hypothetical protein